MPLGSAFDLKPQFHTRDGGPRSQRFAEAIDQALFGWKESLHPAQALISSGADYVYASSLVLVGADVSTHIFLQIPQDEVLRIHQRSEVVRVVDLNHDCPKRSRKRRESHIPIGACSVTESASQTAGAVKF